MTNVLKRFLRVRVSCRVQDMRLFHRASQFSQTTCNNIDSIITDSAVVDQPGYQSNLMHKPCKDICMVRWTTKRLAVWTSCTSICSEDRAHPQCLSGNTYAPVRIHSHTRQCPDRVNVCVCPRSPEWVPVTAATRTVRSIGATRAARTPPPTAGCPGLVRTPRPPMRPATSSIASSWWARSGWARHRLCRSSCTTSGHRGTGAPQRICIAASMSWPTVHRWRWTFWTHVVRWSFQPCGGCRFSLAMLLCWFMRWTIWRRGRRWRRCGRWWENHELLLDWISNLHEYKRI